MLSPWYIVPHFPWGFGVHSGSLKMRCDGAGCVPDCAGDGDVDSVFVLIKSGFILPTIDFNPCLKGTVISLFR